jgi:hypothetical protein
MYRFSDDDGNVVKVTTTGFWDIATARTYLAELRRRVTEMRERRGYALALVDGRNSTVQPQEVMEEFADIESLLIAAEGDRAAYVVADSLAKMQGQRLATSNRLKVFLSPTAAYTWLTAYEGTARAS